MSARKNKVDFRFRFVESYCCFLRAFSIFYSNAVSEER